MINIRIGTLTRTAVVAALIGISCSGAMGAPEAAQEATGNQSKAAPAVADPAGALQAAQKAADAAQKAAEAAQQAAAAAKQAADQAASSAGSAASAGKQSVDAAGNAAVTAQSAGDVAKQAAANAQNSASNVEKAKSQAQAAAGMAGALADTAKKSALNADAAAGVALNGSTNVKDNVTIQSVLLPYKQTRKVFSKEIADHYAVVQITINNQSKDAAFLLHSAFLDYSHWALSGGFDPATTACQPSTVNSQVGNCASQVASVESRVIRGELQDAANWTWRNGLIRAAVLVGTVGSAIPAFHSTNALKYVGAYNGQFIPGVQVLFPDSTVPQLNRVSDFGFQNNKVIAEDSADLVYAFFPVERFLTPGISKIFLKAPAIFFAPPQMFIDQHIGVSWKPWSHLSKSDVDELKHLIEDLAANACQASDVPDKTICPVYTEGQEKQRDEKMLQLLMTDCTCPVPADNVAGGETKSQSCNNLPSACNAAGPTQKLVRDISLNSINVIVQGTMTVDVTTVPGQIDDITFGAGNEVGASWETTDKPIDVVIKGRFLTNATPEIPGIEAPAPNESDIRKYIDAKTITVVTDDSTDTRLHFKLQWTKAIPSGSTLHVQVTKTDSKDTKKTPVKSMDFKQDVRYVPSAKPAGTPSISGGVQFDKEAEAATWKSGSTLKGTATGRALDNAKLEVTNMATSDGRASTVSDYLEAPITDASKTSDAKTYFFTMKIRKNVPTDSKLTLQVSATGNDGNAIKGDTAQYQVKYNP